MYAERVLTTCHWLHDIPIRLVGGGAERATGRAHQFDGVPHNRIGLALAHGLGHDNLKTFGSEQFCAAGPLGLS